MKQFDSIIIGFGKGGKTLAGHLAKQGKKVAVIEKSDMMYGGTCINVGCIPSKSLVHSAAESKLHNDVSFTEKAVLYRKAIEEKRSLTAKLRKKNYHKLSDHPNITVINGEASFLSSTSIAVKQEEGIEELQAPNIFINTGSSSVISAIKGIDNNPYVFYSDTLMNLDKLPKHLIIIGGGYIGLEFASMYANFGSKVTVLQHGGIFLPKEDEDIAAEIRGNLEAQGIQFLLNADTQEITSDGNVLVEVAGSLTALSADAVLIAVGRRANVEGLHLEAAGVEQTERGAVKTNEWRQTTAENIFAMGDVVGGLQFTYVSLDDYRIVSNYLDGKKTYSEKSRQHVPYSVFMEIPFSRVGMNEREAKQAGFEIKVMKLPAMAIPKAQVLKKPAGLLKAVIDVETNKILGATLLCEESYEMINLVKLAMDLNADYTVLRDQIFTHPTMSEALNDLFSM